MLPIGASRTIDNFDGKSHSCGMSDKEKYPSELAERFQIRLPNGLRDRIKAYAERHGRSMNTEIVRVLEREFPEPWSLESRVSDLLGLVAVLGEASAEEAVDKLNHELLETVRGIVSGRVTGVDESMRARIREQFERWEITQLEDHEARYTGDMDEEELDAYSSGQGPIKF